MGLYATVILSALCTLHQASVLVIQIRESLCDEFCFKCGSLSSSLGGSRLIRRDGSGLGALDQGQGMNSTLPSTHFPSLAATL